MQIIAIPLPFSAALLAGIVAVKVLLAHRQRGPAGLFIGLFFALLAVQGLLSGLKFGYSISLAVYLQPVLAMLVGPLAYLAFRVLRGPGNHTPGFRDLLHLPAPALVAVIQWFHLAFPVPVDLLIWCSFLVYALLLLSMARDGPDSFEDFNTDDMRTLTRARLITAFLLLLISSVDVLIFVDLTYLNGVSTTLYLSAGSLVLIAVSIGALLLPADYRFFARGSVASHSDLSAEAYSSIATADDRALLRRLNLLMETKKPYLDANINITRTGRLLNVPARTVSVAVNRCLGRNFSQYINHHRIREACQLLLETDLPVTDIQFEAGFQTKSNFNREFRRAMGVSPSAYRRSSASKPTG